MHPQLPPPPHAERGDSGEDQGEVSPSPCRVVGGITNIDEAEEILAAGKADMVAMARALIADQDLVTKAKLGKSRGDPALPAVPGLLRGPSKGAPLRCAVNPQAGREVKYREIPLARKKKRVLVDRRRSRGHDGRANAVRTRARRDAVGEVRQAGRPSLRGLSAAPEGHLPRLHRLGHPLDEQVRCEDRAGQGSDPRGHRRARLPMPSSWPLGPS